VCFLTAGVWFRIDVKFSAVFFFFGVVYWAIEIVDFIFKNIGGKK